MSRYHCCGGLIGHKADCLSLANPELIARVKDLEAKLKIAEGALEEIVEWERSLDSPYMVESHIIATKALASLRSSDAKIREGK